MDKPAWWASPRWNSIITILIVALIGVVCLTTALAAWRSNVVGSGAGDASRQGLIDAIKKQASVNEHWRKTYEEATYAQSYAVYVAQIETLEKSDDPTANAQAANLRQYLLPSLAQLSAPLSAEPAYRKADGSYDLQKRFANLQAERPALSGLTPETSLQQADLAYAEQRWLTVGLVLLALSLFWLALAQIGGARLRLLTLLFGVGAYGLSLAWFAMVEVLYLFILRSGIR